VTAPARFTQADIRRAAAGVTAAGLGIAKIEIDLSGKIVIIPATGQPQADNDEWADLG
jgi:hypothetical protein